MPEPQASLQQKLLRSEGIALETLTIDMKVYSWSPKRKARKNSGKSKSKSRRISTRKSTNRA